MHISLRQTGGVFGLQRDVRVQESSLLVTDGESVVIDRQLRPDEQIRVSDLVRRLIETGAQVKTSTDLPPSDSMLTELTVESEGRPQTYQLRSGDQAPPEVWALVGTLSEVADAPAS